MLFRSSSKVASVAALQSNRKMFPCAVSLLAKAKGLEARGIDGVVCNCFVLFQANKETLNRFCMLITMHAFKAWLNFGTEKRGGQWMPWYF